MNIKKNIPNLLTLGNLLCGCMAIIHVFEGSLVWAAYLVGIALVLDFFDGFTARLLKVSSPIGKDLDSLADMVTFGVVPGMVMFRLIGDWMTFYTSMLTDWPNDIGGKPNLVVPDFVLQLAPLFPYLKYVGLLIPIFSAVRLARFNNDTRQSDSFIGLPTPANAMVICSIPLIDMHAAPVFSGMMPWDTEFEMRLSSIAPQWLIVACVVLSLLLVAELPLFALKFKGFSWADHQNKLRFVFLGLSVVLLISLQFVAIPLIILLYILLSIVNNLFLKKRV